MNQSLVTSNTFHFEAFLSPPFTEPTMILFADFGQLVFGKCELGAQMHLGAHGFMIFNLYESFGIYRAVIPLDMESKQGVVSCESLADDGAALFA
jgi:hypothetical protein